MHPLSNSDELAIKIRKHTHHVGIVSTVVHFSTWKEYKWTYFPWKPYFLLFSLYSGEFCLICAFLRLTQLVSMGSCYVTLYFFLPKGTFCLWKRYILMLSMDSGVLGLKCANMCAFLSLMQPASTGSWSWSFRLLQTKSKVSLRSLSPWPII